MLKMEKFLMAIKTMLMLLGAFAALGMASPNSAFTTMVTTFGLSGIVGKLCAGSEKFDSRTCSYVVVYV